MFKKLTFVLICFSLFGSTVVHASLGIVSQSVSAPHMANVPPFNYNVQQMQQLAFFQAMQMQQLGVTMPNVSTNTPPWWANLPSGAAAGGWPVSQWGGLVPPVPFGLDLNQFNSWDEYYSWLDIMGMSPWFGNYVNLPVWGGWGSNNPWFWMQQQGHFPNWGISANAFGFYPNIWDGPIHFGNSHIENEVRRITNIQDRQITPQDVYNIQILVVRVPNNSIPSANALNGLEAFTNLRELRFTHVSPTQNSGSNLSNFNAIYNLRNLQILQLDGHVINNLQGLRNMQNLQRLYLAHNNIYNINYISYANLFNLHHIDLSHNNINNFNALWALNLNSWYISNNPGT